MKRIGILCACLLMANQVAAATLVTWQADGSVTRMISDRLVPPAPGIPVSPPIGTPLSVTFSFDPAAAQPSFGGGPGSGCVTVPLAGSVTIGGFTTAAAADSAGFTNSSVPGSVCNSSGRTEFTFFIPEAPVGSYALPAGMLLLSYRDLLIQDAFPSVPHPSFLADVTFLANGSFSFETVFEGKATLSALDQSAPVPEPGTMSLLALGLAAAVRRTRANVSSRSR
jgi:hypothetical protein